MEKQSKNKKKLNIEIVYGNFFNNDIDSSIVKFVCLQTSKEKIIRRTDIYDLRIQVKVLSEEYKYFSKYSCNINNKFSFNIFANDKEYSEIFYGIENYNEDENLKDIKKIFLILEKQRKDITNDKKLFTNFLLEFYKIKTSCETCVERHKNNYCKIFNKINPNVKKCYFYKE